MGVLEIRKECMRHTEQHIYGLLGECLIVVCVIVGIWVLVSWIKGRNEEK